MVITIARGYKGYGLPQADLIQEGNVGLMKAVRHFDPERGVRLVSFASHWVKAEIHEFILRNWRLVKIATTKAQRKLFFNLRSMKKTLDTMRPEEAHSMAKRLGVKVKEVIEMETRFSGRDISIEPLSEEEDEKYSPIAYLTNGSEPSQTLENEQNSCQHVEGLDRALASLDERSRRIVETRWLQEKKVQHCMILLTNLAYQPNVFVKLRLKRYKNARSNDLKCAEIAVTISLFD